MNELKKKFFPCFMDHQNFLSYAKLVYLSKNERFTPCQDRLYLIDEGVFYWEFSAKKYHAFIGEGDYFGFDSEEKKSYKPVTDAVLWEIPLSFIHDNCPVSVLAEITYRDTARYERWQGLEEKRKRATQEGIWCLALRMQQTRQQREAFDDHDFFQLFSETSLTDKEKEKFLLYLINQCIVLKAEQIYVLSYVNLSEHIEEMLGF
ncbi:hypothetical protein [Listeria aquatica]|uniref:Uncharacterized protein n=1 Tax=Listeria aquatica FSL S10-1188 TaxID=1265818 RepID=W7BGV5_9LIST|nr:hypothetical protein [Listeria aquatica]EUJ18968.1 hypothetical protein MAQA_07718 [Listeria aquatica FSL S10-1188]